MKTLKDLIFESFPEGFFTNKKIKHLKYSKPFNSSSFTFVQIGANDGKLMDPIRKYILQYNWQGVFVEPVPTYFKLLKQNYKDQKRLRFANYAVTRKNSVEILYVVKSSNNIPLKFNGMSTFSREQLIEQLKKAKVRSPENYLREVKVQSLTLKNLFTKYKLQHVNLMVIDVEGYEPAILKQIKDLQHYPEVILFEHHWIPKVKRLEIKQELKRLGYKIQNAGFPWIDSLAYLY